MSRKKLPPLFFKLLLKFTIAVWCLIMLSCEKEDHLVIPNKEIVLIDMTNGET